MEGLNKEKYQAQMVDPSLSEADKKKLKVNNLNSTVFNAVVRIRRVLGNIWQGLHPVERTKEKFVWETEVLSNRIRYC